MKAFKYIVVLCIVWVGASCRRPPIEQPPVRIQRSATTVITSVIPGGKSAENITVNSVSWSTDEGTITLSANVPGTVKIGDSLTDNGGHSYVITGISGSDVDAIDYDSATDPVTGTGTIQETYQSFTTWESELDNSTFYRSGDAAEARLIGTTTESVTLNGGGTVGLASRHMTADPSTYHDGTDDGSAVWIVNGTNPQVNITGGTVDTEISWIIFRVNSSQNFDVCISKYSAGGDNLEVHHNICNGTSHTPANDTGFIFVGWSSGITFAGIYNNIIYGGIDHGIHTSRAGGPVYNNTLYDLSAHGMWRETSGTFNATNNIVIDCTADFSGTFSGDYNCDSDGTAPGANSITDDSGEFVDDTGYDLHLAGSADSRFAGIGPSSDANVPTEDIDNETRSGTQTDIGADLIAVSGKVISVF